MKKILFAVMLLTFTLGVSMAQQDSDVLSSQIKMLCVENAELRRELSMIEKELDHTTVKYDFISQQYIDYKDHISMDNNHTLWILGILVSLMGVGFPIYSNWKNDKNISDKINIIEEKITKVGEIEKRMLAIESTVNKNKKISEKAEIESKANMFFWRSTTTNDIKTKIDLLDKAIHLSPGNIELYYSRGLAYVDIEDYYKAISDFDVVIGLAPKSADTYCNRATAKGQIKDYQGAIDDFTSALLIDSSLASAYSNMGSMKNKMGDLQGAIECFTKAIEKDLLFSMAYINRGIVFGQMGKYDEAIDDFNSAIVVDPSNPMAYTNRAIAKSKLNKNEDAIKDYTRAIELNPRLAQAYRGRGVIKARVNIEEATEDLSIAYHLDPNMKVELEEFKRQNDEDNS